MGISRRSPKSATLQVSFSPTRMLRAAKSCTAVSKERGCKFIKLCVCVCVCAWSNQKIKVHAHFICMHTYSVYETLFSEVMHSHGDIDHVLDKLFNWLFVFLEEKCQQQCNSQALIKYLNCTNNYWINNAYTITNVLLLFTLSEQLSNSQMQYIFFIAKSYSYTRKL